MEESVREEGDEKLEADSAVEEQKAGDSQNHLILIGQHRQITFL